MKKFNLIAFTGILMLLPFLQSCLDDTDNRTWYNSFPTNGKLDIGTIKVQNPDTPRDFYIALDNGQNILPTDTTDIRNTKYTVAEGQRAFVVYQDMGEKKPGYKNGKIFMIENILTKDIIPLTEATADSIGDDRINVIAHALTKEYLTIEFQYLGSANKKHMLNLVQNETEGSIENDGYIYLEFRHNAFKDYTDQLLRQNIVSFKLDRINEQLATAKGIKLRVNTIYDNIKQITIDLNKEKNQE